MSGDGVGLEALRVLLRWLHLLAAASWVGGIVFYVAVLGPALRSAGAPPPVAAAIGREFGPLVRLCILVFIVTGALLTFDRLADGRGSTLYAALLALKVAAAGAMFAVAWELARRQPRHETTRGRALLLLALGVLILLLAPALRAVYGS